MKIEWQPPKPRSGAQGYWEAFVGPGATPTEEWLQLGLGGVIATACILQFATEHGPEAAWYHFAIVVLLALDIGGGIVTNAANSAKRWYHRDGYPKWKHLAFVATHGLHLGVVAALFATDPWIFFCLTFGGLMAFSVLILSVPLYLQRPTAFGLGAVSITFAQFAIFAVPGLAWFLPLMILKLLIGHLVKEAPFRPDVTK